jgi:hypothetical protein
MGAVLFICALVLALPTAALVSAISADAAMDRWLKRLDDVDQGQRQLRRELEQLSWDG